MRFDDYSTDKTQPVFNEDKSDARDGKYRIYAEGQIGIYRWSNPNFVREMESMGTEVEVREKDELRLQLKQIPKEETARILDKLSLQ